MSKGLPRSLSRGNALESAVKKIRLSLDEAITFTGSTGVAVGGAATIAGIPEGNLMVIGAVANLTFTGPTSANLADDFQGDFGIGTAPTVDNDLGDSEEANIIASTAIPAASSEVSSVRATNVTPVIVDNTDSSKAIQLNVLLDADEVSDGEDVVVTVTGTVDILYSVLGDD